MTNLFLCLPGDVSLDHLHISALDLLSLTALRLLQLWQVIWGLGGANQQATLAAVRVASAPSTSCSPSNLEALQRR